MDDFILSTAGLQSRIGHRDKISNCLANVNLAGFKKIEDDYRF